MSLKPPFLDDVAALPPERNLELTLDHVGMENVQTQVRVNGLMLPAVAHAGVSLVDPKSRGIHMSRLFKQINRLHEDELSWTLLSNALDQILTSHEGLSDTADLSVSFTLPVLRKALLSEEEGWRNYPVSVRVRIENERPLYEMSVRVLYSSTCPCSASLSRQAMEEQFRKDFQEATLSKENVLAWLGQNGARIAVPHSQRSEAFVTATVDPTAGVLSPLSLIDEIEDALKTPVQGPVKREDEQEFARLNAKNPMFCEDAARKLKAALMRRDEMTDFAIEVRHFESLHAHDVIARVRKHH